MSSHSDSFVCSGSSPTGPDFMFENHGSVFLLRPISPTAFLWIHENLPSDRQMFGNAVAVERRYFAEFPRKISELFGSRNDECIFSIESLLL